MCRYVPYFDPSFLKHTDMKKIKLLFIGIACSFLLSSCFTYTTVVGDGAENNKEIQKWNHYFLWGLAPGNVSNPAELAGESKNYDVKTEQSFVNGLVNVLTFGIYAPTTTTITK